LNTNYNFLKLLTLIILLIAISGNAFAQTELQPWGNITGIRKHGQLYNFESAIRLVRVDRQKIAVTAKEKQTPHYARINDNEQEVTTWLDSLFFKENVKEDGGGKIKVTIQMKANADTVLQGVYFTIKLPAEYLTANLRYSGGNKPEFDHFVKAVAVEYDDDAKQIEFETPARQFSIKPDDKSVISIRKDNSGGKEGLMIFIPLKLGSITKGDTLQKEFDIKVSGDIDKSPAVIAVNIAKQGRVFDGLGGNVRLQNPKTDPQVIDYCLQNLRVAWGRVEMPWQFWQPKLEVNPAQADTALHPAVKKAMEMAHRLDSMGIPLILSGWFPPEWAAEGKLNPRPVNGVWGNPLNKDNMQAIYKSIADYILYLKNKYGTEVKLFSFNESDLGINVRVTPQEHDDFIKGCGAYLASRGLKTKMLLGDNSDANTYQFIYPAMNDPEAKPYIGAISFHSWRGWDDATLQKWADAAKQLNVPLIVGEGSIDAAAWNYPDIFQEQTYALEEINLYIRLLAICQPASILQWQLTADYSPLIGGGIFGNNEPLHPGQRFWNLKQLSITPKGLFAMPVTCNKPEIACAALGDNEKGIYAVHVVNNGIEREVTLTGLPANVKQFDIYTTTKKDAMKQGKVKVENGQAKFKLAETSYTTIISR